MEKVQEEESIVIDLRITEGTQKTQSYECETKDLLETYIKEFTKEFQLNYSSYIVLYGARALFDEALKIPISKIISKIDKQNKKMALLLIENSGFDIHDQDEIMIILTKESAKKPTLIGKKGQN